MVTIDSKRARFSNETDHDTGSESARSSPHPKAMVNYNNSENLSPVHTGPPSSPESDLDVDSAPDEATPENLSLKKEESTSPPHSSSSAETIRNFGANNNPQGFVPYHHTHFLAAAAAANSNSPIVSNSNHQHHIHSHSSHHNHQATSILTSSHIFNTTDASVGGLQRSPVDVLMRVFPNHRRHDVEQMLQRFRGDILQTMEFILSGENISQLHSSQPTSNNLLSTLPPTSPFPLKSAFSPLVPPTSVFNSNTHRYSTFMQGHAKRFLSTSFANSNYMNSAINSTIDIEQSESNSGAPLSDHISNAGDSQD